MKTTVVAIIAVAVLARITLVLPEPVPSIETITTDELSAMNADQLTAIILKNIVHDSDDKAPAIEIVIRELLQDIDTLIADVADGDNEKSKLYHNVRQKVEDFLNIILEDTSSCGLYSLVASVSNQIVSFLLFQDQQLYHTVWQKHFSDDSVLFDFQSHMESTAITSEKMEEVFKSNETLQKEVTKKVNAEVGKCKKVEILGMHFLEQNVDL